MKKKIFFYIGLLFLGLQSCSLDEELIDTPNPTLISTEDDVDALIHGLYARLNDGGAFKYNGFLMLTLSADDIYSTVGSEFGPFAQRTYTGADVELFWDQMFLTIGAANNLIKVLDDLELSDSYERRAYGEAYFMRAFCYYYLVRLFGGVPLRLEVANIGSDFYLPRSSVDDVYAQIFVDFAEAGLRLPLASALSTAQIGRATKGAAHALLAQAYLTYGNQLSLKGEDPKFQYEESWRYCDSVILSNQYTILDEYADLFDIAKENNAYREVIFGIRFQVDPQARALGSAGSEVGYYFGVPNSHFVSGNAPYGNGNGAMRPMPWVADFYRKGDYANAAGTVVDYRNEVAFMQLPYNSVEKKYYATYPNIPAANQGVITVPVIGKYIDPNGKDSRNNGNDFFVIRFPEIYLIKAEVLNELDRKIDAFFPFNRTRERARKGKGTGRNIPANVNATTHPTITKSELRMKIFHERGLEFIAEGQRWFDLVRMQHPTDPTKTMYEYQLMEELTKSTYSKAMPGYNATTKTYTNRNAVYQPALNVSRKFLLFPIPTGELLKNPNFGEQNPDW